MKKFNWATTAFNFGVRKNSYKIHIEESEDGLAMAIEMLHEVKHKNAPEEIKTQVEEIAGDLSSTLDKLRMLRTNMKSMT